MHDEGERPAHNGRTGRKESLRQVEDETLLARARDGDQRAFAELYQRHAEAAHAYARRLSLRHLHRDVADDVLAEAVRKILEAMAHGLGPRREFRRYLFASVRSVVYTQSRLGPTVSLDHDMDRGIDPVDGWLDGLVAIDAFNDLPRRWQDVLWATTVLGYSPTDLAPTAGLTTNNVAVLSRRARDGLRIAYARRYLPRDSSRGCAPFLDALARSSFGGAAPNATPAVMFRRHLDRCATCRTAAADLHDGLARSSPVDVRAQAAAG